MTAQEWNARFWRGIKVKHYPTAESSGRLTRTSTKAWQLPGSPAMVRLEDRVKAVPLSSLVVEDEIAKGQRG